MRNEQPASRFRLTGDDVVIWSRRGWRRSGSASAGCSAGRILSGRALRHAGNRATRSGGLRSGRWRGLRLRARARAERGRRRDGEKADLHDEMVVCFRWDDLASPNEWRRERSSYELTHTGLGTLWIPLTLRERRCLRDRACASRASPDLLPPWISPAPPPYRRHQSKSSRSRRPPFPNPSRRGATAPLSCPAEA